jgi:glycosyltransferase involved in cell wall biosynthesis
MLHEDASKVHPKVYIALATHNGAEYLNDQLESIQAQDFDKWTLLISDDGSTDSTLSIIDDYAARDRRIEACFTGSQPLRSAKQNFARLLDAAHAKGAEYVLCCDQDDIWRPNKISKTLKLFGDPDKALATPTLVHHDLRVVDAQGLRLADSYWKMMRLRPGTEDQPERLLSRNEVTGCAMACNRALLDVALPLPTTAIMHDWWFAICAAFFGKLRFIDEALVDYRQHPKNVIGAKSFWNLISSPGKLRTVWLDGTRELLRTFEQARSLLERFNDFPAIDPPDSIAAYVSLPDLDRSQRLKRLRAARAWRHQWLLDSTLLVRTLLLSRNEP